MNTSPVSAVSSPAMTRSSVDLPLPLGPSSAVNEPLPTPIDTSSSAVKSPNRFVTLRASIAMGFLSRSDHRHQQQGQDRAAPEQNRRRIRARLVEVLVGR